MNLDMDKITSIATTLGMVLTGAFICYKVTKANIEKFLENWQGSVSSKVSKQSQLDTCILKRMEEVKEILDADRVHVYEFHNGEHYANGRSALKISCTYEVCRAGVKAIQKENLSVPISCIPKYIASILENPIVRVKDLECVKDSMPSTYNLEHSHNIAAYMDVVLLNKAKEPVGFIEVQWSDKSKYNENDHELLRLAAYIEENILSSINKR